MGIVRAVCSNIETQSTYKLMRTNANLGTIQQAKRKYEVADIKWAHVAALATTTQDETKNRLTHTNKSKWNKLNTEMSNPSQLSFAKVSLSLKLIRTNDVSSDHDLRPKCSYLFRTATVE